MGVAEARLGLLVACFGVAVARFDFVAAPPGVAAALFAFVAARLGAVFAALLVAAGLDVSAELPFEANFPLSVFS